MTSGMRPIAVGIVALIAEARQSALPVRRQQPQRIPALGAPRVRHLAALQDHMIDRALGEAPAHGEAGVPGPDDDGGDVANGSRSSLDLATAPSTPAQVTSTVTFVGLVTMSYTAERFCDCATSASMSSRLASASIL